MTKYKMSDLTELEQQAIREVEADDTGYLFFDRTSIPGKQLRGVLSSLTQKGIIRPTYNQDFEFVSDDYDDWFYQ